MKTFLNFVLNSNLNLKRSIPNVPKFRRFLKKMTHRNPNVPKFREFRKASISVVNRDLNSNLNWKSNSNPGSRFLTKTSSTLRQSRRKKSNRLLLDASIQSPIGWTQHNRHDGRHRRQAKRRRVEACSRRKEAALEGEEGCDAIVQCKSIALRKIRCIGSIVRGRFISLIVRKLTKGGVVIGVVVVGELTEHRRAIVCRRCASTRRRRIIHRRICGPSPARTATLKS